MELKKEAFLPGQVHCPTLHSAEKRCAKSLRV